MKKLLFMLLMLFAVTLFSSFESNAQTRINFAPGARSATVTGTLNGFRGKRVYLIRVRRGQVLRTENLGHHEITIEVLDPRGDEAADSDASCNSTKETGETAAGDYKIIVTECQKADRWKGSFKFKVNVRNH
jgi:hypothetical protein